MKKLIGVAVLTSLVLGVVAYAQAQTKADQGAPGNQGPWPVKLVGSSGGDGGSNSTTYNLPALCKAAPTADGGNGYAVTTIATTSTPVPALPLAGRSYIVVTLTAGTINPSTAAVKCATGGAAVNLTAASPGDVLQYGDSVVYSAAQTNVIDCVADAGYVVTSFECVPQT